MNKKTLWICTTTMLLLLISQIISGGYSTNIETKQELIIENPLTNNPKIYYDVKILLRSTVFEVSEINGFHGSNSGYGYDDSITLFGSFVSLFGILAIWNKSEIKELNFHGGWLNTKLEIFGYNGWMRGQYKLTSLKMFGQCDQIKITTYRG